MPELPDVDVYVDTIHRTIVGQALTELRIGNPFLLRSVSPSPVDVAGDTPSDVRRIGKRVAIGFESGRWAVVHLMIAGRFQWKSTRPSLASKNHIASFDFEHGALLLTEAGSKKRASIYLVSSEEKLHAHDPGGIEPLEITATEFATALRARNHTLKRALTDPHILSGIGNAYSDEILHAAGLSPVLLTQRMDDTAMQALFDATVCTLQQWRARLLNEADGKVPGKVTAFRPDMAVHGKFGKPCPVCGDPVQRIRYKSNETNYCATCQTGGRVLKDRSLSKLLKQDWPRTLDDL